MGCRENPYLEPIADFRFSPYACGNVVDLPHVAKRTFGTEWASVGNKTCRLAVPLITGQKLETFLK